MKLLRNALLIVTILLTLYACGRNDVYVIKGNKIGGLYETNENGSHYTLYDGSESFILDTMTFISFSNFVNFQQEESPLEGVYSLAFSLNETAALKFKEMTGRNIRKKVCFVVNDKVMAAPIVLTAIPDGKVSIVVADKEAVEQIIEYLTH